MKVNELEQIVNDDDSSDLLFFKRFSQGPFNTCAIAAYKACLEEIGISTPSISKLSLEVTGNSSIMSDGTTFIQIYNHAKRKGYKITMARLYNIKDIASIVNQGNPAIVSVENGEHAVAVHKITKTHVFYADSAPLGIFFDPSNIKRRISSFNNYLDRGDLSLILYRRRNRRR